MEMFTTSFLITLAYGLLSVVLYTAIVYVILRNKNHKLNSSFFTIFVIGYFINLATFFNSYITLRLPQNTCQNCSLAFLFNSEKSSRFPLGIFYAISINMAFVQTSMTLLISLNRFTTFIFLSDKDWLWKFKILPIVMFIILLWPFTITHPVIINPTYYYYYESLLAYRTKTESDLSTILVVLNVFMILIAVFSALLNLFSLRSLKKLGNNVKKSEKALAYTTFVAFFIQLFAIIDTLIINLVSSTGDYAYILSIAQFLQTYVSDSLTFNQPYVLLCCSSVVREELCLLFTKRNDIVTMVGDRKSTSQKNTSWTPRTQTATP